MKTLDVFEHGRLIIDEKTFTRQHWEAFVKLNTVHNGEYFDILHNGLKFKQYVGVLQIDGLLVHIHPKADKDDSDATWKGVLLKMLKACGRVKAQSAGNAHLRKQNLNLLEVYFDYYLSELEGLLHSGLIKKYRKETNNVKALKGKLEFAANIRKNLVHQERFYTTHQVYDTNHKLHQILAHALEILGKFTRATHMNDRFKRVSLSFPEVDGILPTLAYLESVKIDRKTKAYERALELAKLIILNYSPDINYGNQKMIALLFDMNQLWEEYVLKMLKKYSNEYPDEGWEITGQESRLFYGSYRTIRPDIVIRNGDNTYVIDTKWKRPQNNTPSIEDLRQMYAYARFWKTNKVVLLYPGDHFDSGYKPYPNRNDHEVEFHQCKIAMVNVLCDGRLSEKLAEDIIELI